MRIPRTVIALILAVLCVAALTRADEHVPNQADLAQLSPNLSWIRTEGFRLGYNYSASLDWYPRAKVCGMNGIISRLEIANDPSGDEALDGKYPEAGKVPDFLRCWRLVRPSSRAAEQNGLRFFYMLNLGSSRGTINDGFRDNPRRYNNAKLFSPLDDIYWTRVVENRFLRVAEMLAGDEYAIDGFLIDPEMYAEGGATPSDVDYGDFALSEFVKATGEELEFEGVSIAQRRRLIAERGLKDRLYEFESERVRAFAQRTRQKLQAKVPDAILGFFLWRDHLWFKAVAAGFSTPTVPCWVGPESTYPGAFDEAFLDYQDAVRRQAGVPILFVPGLRYGYEGGAAPTEFLKVLPGNLYHRSINTQGYWFWAMSRLGRTENERAPFIKVLRTVNAELDRFFAANRKYQSLLRPAPLPAGLPMNLRDLLSGIGAWQPVPPEALPKNDPGPAGMSLRGLSAFGVLAKEGQEIAFRVQNVRLGPYTSATACTFYGPDGSQAQQCQIPLGETRTVTQQADKAGVWILAITSHNNAFWIMPEADSCVLASPQGFHLCKSRGPQKLSRFFFYVPRAAASFKIQMSASEGETATFRVFNAAGEMVCQHEKLDKEITEEFVTGDQAGRVWWLETQEAVEDHGFLLVGIPNIVAARADRLLVPAP